MNFFIVIFSFLAVWAFIEITFLISARMVTNTSSGFSHNQFMWNLRIIALFLFAGSAFVINYFNFSLTEFVMMCFI
ncbi:MAG: hypothetical protein CMO13_04445 [Thaumarchaeota archaeon]|nr:hypothetical protein [Nitrososphaerota archaeon]